MRRAPSNDPYLWRNKSHHLAVIWSAARTVRSPDQSGSNNIPEICKSLVWSQFLGGGCVVETVTDTQLTAPPPLFPNTRPPLSLSISQLWGNGKTQIVSLHSDLVVQHKTVQVSSLQWYFQKSKWAAQDNPRASAGKIHISTQANVANPICLHFIPSY